MIALLSLRVSSLPSGRGQPIAMVTSGVVLSEHGHSLKIEGTHAETRVGERGRGEGRERKREFTRFGLSWSSKVIHATSCERKEILRMRQAVFH